MTPPPASIPPDEDTVPYALFRESPATYMAQTYETHRETVAILRDVAAAEAEAAHGQTLSPAEVESSPPRCGWRGNALGRGEDGCLNRLRQRSPRCGGLCADGR